MGRFGINEKQAAGRVRKATAEEEKRQKKEQEKEAALSREWEIGSKDESKKKELELKRLKKLQSKAETREVLEQEEIEISKTSKVKRSGIQYIHESSNNVPSYAANNIDDAIFLMQTINTGSSESFQDIERHPERRMKAAYAEFEDKQLSLLKKEYPSLRLSQLKQLAWKKWKKSPDNPFNQPHISYAATKEEREQIHSEVVTENLERLKISPSTDD